MLNGKDCTLDVKPNKTPLSLLKEDLELMGTKCGCGVGECGICTILMNRDSVSSCLILAPQINGSNIVTIEDLSNGKILDPIQKAFIEVGAVQCGFCTPRMIMSIKGLLSKNTQPIK